MTTTRSREVVYVYELAKERDDNVLSEFEFNDCVIVGPAVLIVLDDNTFERCSFPSTDVFWPIATGRQYFGGIGLRNVVFTDCRFERVGLAASQDLVDRFLKDFG